MKNYNGTGVLYLDFDKFKNGFSSVSVNSSYNFTDLELYNILISNDKPIYFKNFWYKNSIGEITKAEGYLTKCVFQGYHMYSFSVVDFGNDVIDLINFNFTEGTPDFVYQCYERNLA